MNQLKTKIDEVKAKLGLTQMQLSERIGKNPYYLDTVKHRGVTTERQNELMLELDFVLGGGLIDTPNDIAEMLDIEREVSRNLRQEIAALKEENSAIKAVNGVAIKERYELQQKVVSLAEYKHQYRDLVATVLVVGIIVVLGLAIWSVV